MTRSQIIVYIRRVVGNSFNGIFKSKPDNVPEKFALIGTPFDAGSTYRPGSRLGPTSIREFARSLNTCTESGMDLVDLNAVDHGDLTLNNRVKTAFRTIREKVGGILEAGSMPIVLGGDHSITVPCFEAALGRFPNLRLLYMDAHPDLYPEYDGDPYSHACVVSRILELDAMNGDRITQVGIRASTADQQSLSRQSGIQTVHAWEAERFEYVSDDPVYLSFDIDVLDPAHAPGCGNPVPGGLSSRQAINVLHSIQAPIVAMDIVEVNPLLDPYGITALAAARIVIESLGVMIKHQI